MRLWVVKREFAKAVHYFVNLGDEWGGCARL